MLFFKKIFKNLTLDDLPSYNPSKRELRAQTQVLIIDDKEFVNEEGLRNAQFNVTVHKKWNTVRDVEPYSIIVSDNQGVVDSGGESDGLTMINEARKIYPDKKFALYSGNLLDIRNRDVQGLPIRTKGDSLESWINMLDQMTVDYYNPRLLWEKIRLVLADSDCSEKEIRKLQHFFVLSVLNKETKISTQNWNIDTNTISLIIKIAGLAVSGARLALAL